MSDIERRDLFKIVAAGAIAAPLVAAPRSPFFTPAQIAVLDRLGDIIIPTDEQSPGAHEAGVVHYLDLLASVSPPARQQNWRSGIAAVEAASNTRFSRAFMECAREQQEQIVALMAAHEFQPQNDLERFFDLLKQTVVDGYRWSEVGVTRYMRWVGNQFETGSWTGACDHPEHGANHA
jgi:hypothetical protein